MTVTARRYPPRARWSCLGAVAVALFALAGWAVHRDARPLVPVRPQPAPPAVNGYDDFVRAGALTARMSGIGDLELLAARAIRPDNALIARIAGQSAPVSALLRTGLRKPCAVPVRRTYEAAVSAPGWPMGTLARVLVTTAEHQADAGRSGEAVRLLLDALDAVERCRQGGCIRDSLACEAAARLPAAAQRIDAATTLCAFHASNGARPQRERLPAWAREHRSVSTPSAVRVGYLRLRSSLARIMQCHLVYGARCKPEGARVQPIAH